MQKNLIRFQDDPVFKLVLKPVPSVLFQLTRNVQRRLLRSKLYLLQHTGGSYKFDSFCYQTDRNVKKCYKLSIYMIKDTFKINLYVDCNSRTPIYVRCVVNDIQDLQQTGSGSDEITTIFTKEKLRKETTLCRCIFIDIFKARVTTAWLMLSKLFSLIKLTPQIQLEENNLEEVTLNV